MRWRVRTRRVALCALIAVLVGACGAAAGPASGKRSVKPPRNFYGIVPNTTLTSGDYAGMGNARVGSLRVLVLWPLLQGGYGQPFDWSSIDAIVAGAAQQHIKVLPVLTGTPGFVAGGTCERICSIHILLQTSQQKAGWKAFVSEAVKRYGRHGTFWQSSIGQALPYEPITRWQIWNEQNNPNEQNSPKLYARLLKLTNSAVSAIDPKAQIITGGMFGAPPSGPTAWGYLNKLYRHGVGKFLDGVALHPYAPTISGIKLQIEKIRKVLKKRHHGGVKTFVTEIGWGSSKRRFPGTGSRGAAFNVGPRKQKRNLNESFKLLTSHRKTWKIGGVYWFTWRDPVDLHDPNPPAGYCAFCYSSGLTEFNGTPKPALRAYKKFTRRTRG
jgi:hypothetical protein